MRAILNVLARFKREAHVLASLNHPHIAATYGLEETANASALILELVEGPTLADRIAQGPIPVDETLPIAKQICDALEAAHERGIIHRDLKPANIKLTLDRTVKVWTSGWPKRVAGKEERVHRALQANVLVRDVALGECHDVHAGEGKALDEASRVLLVAAESIERFGQDNVESSIQSVAHQRLEAGAKQCGAGDRVIRKLLHDVPALASCELPADTQLIRYRRIALVVGRVPGVDGDVQLRCPPQFFDADFVNG